MMAKMIMVQCAECGGSGVNDYKWIKDENNHLYRSKCEICNGVGRVQHITDNQTDRPEQTVSTFESKVERLEQALRDIRDELQSADQIDVEDMNISIDNALQMAKNALRKGSKTG